MGTPCATFHDATCGLDEIYAAIDTYDMAIVVRAATNTLRKTATIPMIILVAKSKKESTAARFIGNQHYKAGRNREAINFYNKALVFSPLPSEEMTLAYGNRSAVFFSIRYFAACIDDIDKCLAMECSKNLATKLMKRREDAIAFVYEECASYEIIDTHFVRSFLQFDCNRNAEAPCASEDVEFVNQDGAKRVTAGKDIKPGTVVAIERAFATCTDQNKYLTCYYCNKSDLCLHPCVNCCQALFCSNECRELCMKEYHSIECQIVDYLGSMYEKTVNVLITRSAIKLSLKIGWNAMISASRDIGASRMRTATVKQTFDVNEPLSILSYDDDKHFLEGRMFNGSLVCAAILHCLSRVPGYFPEGIKKREAAFDAMARVMLHLYVTFTNHITILCSAYDFNSRCFKIGLQTNLGWFSMTSKLKHSCEPNLLVVGLNDSVALVSLRTIKKGEELTISYIGHFYDFIVLKEVPFHRVTSLFLYSQYMCDCRVCMHNWDVNGTVNVKMTSRRAVLWKKLNQNNESIFNEDYFNSMCAGLDAFPVNSFQHRCFYEILKVIMKGLQCNYNKNKTCT